MPREAARALTGLSSSLSILGSLWLMRQLARSPSDRAKVGHRLLLILSMCDLVAAAVYLLGVPFDNVENGSPVCFLQSSIGIAAPVASFAWTDAVALFLFRSIVLRAPPSASERLLARAHLLIWPLALLLPLLVLLTDHAGKGGGGSGGDDGDDDDANNTGGWCWVRGSSERELFTWELVGGKLVEWLSCFLIVPLLYLLSCLHIRKLQLAVEQRRTIFGERASSGAPVAPLLEDDARPSRRGGGGGADFARFNLLLALVPLVFFLVRIWSSLRAVLLVASSRNPRWLELMQAFFDPAQGFFNALLFLVTGNGGRGGEPTAKHRGGAGLGGRLAACCDALVARALRLGNLDEPRRAGTGASGSASGDLGAPTRAPSSLRSPLLAPAPALLRPPGDEDSATASEDVERALWRARDAPSSSLAPVADRGFGSSDLASAESAARAAGSSASPHEPSAASVDLGSDRSSRGSLEPESELQSSD